MASSFPSQSEEQATEQEIAEENRTTELRDTPGMLLCERFVKTLDHEGVKSMQSKQNQMLKELEIGNMKLSHCVSHSVAKYEEVAPILRDSTKQLQTMKCDVQSLYRRIRVLKAKLAKKYPDVVAEYESMHRVEVPDEEDEEVSSRLCDVHTGKGNALESNKSACTHERVKEDSSLEQFLTTHKDEVYSEVVVSPTEEDKGVDDQVESNSNEKESDTTQKVESEQENNSLSDGWDDLTFSDPSGT